MSVDLTGAVEAAGRAWFDRGQAQRRDDGRKRPDGQPWQWEDAEVIGQHSYRELVLPIVEAAALVIEAQVRETIAADIAAACYPHPSKHETDPECPACTKAARIARGGK